MLDLANEAGPERATGDSASAEDSLGRSATDSASSTHRRAQRDWEKEEDSEELAGA